MNEWRVFLGLLLLHAVITLAFYSWNKAKESRSQNICETVLAFLLPFFGVLSLVGVKLLLHFRGNGASGAAEKNRHERPQLSGISRYNSEVMSLNDALLVEDSEQKRAFFTNAIKQNSLHNQAIVRQAIQNEDREISHYAVSMVTTQIESLEMELFKIEKWLQQGKFANNTAVWKKYTEVLAAYLSIGFLDAVSQQSRQQRYCEALGKRLSLGDQLPKVYRELIKTEFALARYDAAAEHCSAYQQKFPAFEEPYLLWIELYVSLRDYEKLQQKIAELKASPIKLTIEALRVIRFWDKGAQDV